MIQASLLGVRVLVVDDDEDTRELLALVLREEGAEVRTASDAKDAMRSILQWPPSVVLCDLSMPKTDGLTFLREVRSVPQLRELPAIAVSGLTQPSARAAALAAGFQETISKPLEPDTLVAIVRRAAFGSGAPPGDTPPARPSPTP